MRVEPDGPCPCPIAIVGESPAREEIKLGRGFVGPSGALLWPLLRRLAHLNRSECYVTNLSKEPLDNDVSGEAKMTEEQFDACRSELLDEMGRVGPRSVLAVGVLAAKALLGDAFTTMYACNGVGFDSGRGYTVVPTWHPAAALRGGGEDKLGFTAYAVQNFRAPFIGQTLLVPDPVEQVAVEGAPDYVGIDCEWDGTPDRPICLTWATDTMRSFVRPRDARGFWDSLKNCTIVYHSCVSGDWACMEAMGIERPWEQPFRDTIEMAYARQMMPQGLKDLGWRLFRQPMRTWEDVVMPHYNALVTAMAQGMVEAGTTLVTHSPKGKLLKKPKMKVDPAMQPLKRALKNPGLLAKRLGFEAPSLLHVPQEDLVEYATLDPFMTLALFRLLESGGGA